MTRVMSVILFVLLLFTPPIAAAQSGIQGVINITKTYDGNTPGAIAVKAAFVKTISEVGADVSVWVTELNGRMVMLQESSQFGAVPNWALVDLARSITDTMKPLMKKLGVADVFVLLAVPGKEVPRVVGSISGGIVSVW